MSSPLSLIRHILQLLLRLRSQLLTFRVPPLPPSKRHAHIQPTHNRCKTLCQGCKPSCPHSYPTTAMHTKPYNLPDVTKSAKRKAVSEPPAQGISWPKPGSHSEWFIVCFVLRRWYRRPYEGPRIYLAILEFWAGEVLILNDV